MARWDIAARIDLASTRAAGMYRFVTMEQNAMSLVRLPTVVEVSKFSGIDN